MSEVLPENKQNNNLLFIIVIILLVIISILAFFAWKKSWNKVEVSNTWSTEVEDNSKWGTVKEIDLTVTIIDDKRCVTCNTTSIKESLENVVFLKWAKFDIIDFSDKWTETIMKENEIKVLPAVLLSNNNLNDGWEMKPYLLETKAWNFSLWLWSVFDPYGEICWNNLDDDWNGEIDCDDIACSKELTCAPKVDKPKAELFIMSYCPYWTQAQKGFLEAMLKLKDYADMEIKFVHYLMHWDKEWQENMVQSCIQKEQNDKYNDYLLCFLKDWKNTECREEVKIDETKLSSCVNQTKKDINYDEKIWDKTKQYPDFDLDKTESLAYWVQWSPSFVLNWIIVDKVWRSAKAYADLICNSFSNKPEVCNEEFNNTTYDPNFWFTSNWQVVDWWCWN